MKFDDFIEERKQAAANVLSNYPQFAMVCIGEGVRPCDLRLHLIKEISGMPTSLTSLKRKPQQYIVFMTREYNALFVPPTHCYSSHLVIPSFYFPNFAFKCSCIRDL
ncbi:hypothetical protein MKX01_018659 [Papaver californicum]|nr:hypothetical protein MKX01_018659 [Papaver californicum]